MGAAIQLGAQLPDAEAICAGLIKLLRRSNVYVINVTVGNAVQEIMGPSPNRIAFFPCQPSAGTIRISPNPIMTANQGVLLDATGTTAPLSIFTLAGMAPKPWYGFADAAGRELTIIIADLDCG